MLGHTPGPWEFDGCTDTGKPSCDESTRRYHQIDAPTPVGLSGKFPYTVADTMNRNFCITPKEDAANARLIAAAPDLLSDVRDKLFWLKHCVQQTVHVSVRDERGNYINGFSACQIPEWEVRQKIAELEETIAKVEGEVHVHKNE